MLCTACFGGNPVCRTCSGSGHIADLPEELRGVPRDLRTFGTADNPLHASALPELVRCSWKMALMFIWAPTDESSEAADTGSATHVAVAHWHRDKNLAAAVKAMREASEARFRQANLDEAVAMFLLYARDKRNTEAKILEDKHGNPLLEYPVNFTIQPAPDDPTQAPIAIVGTLDQVREAPDTRPHVWDLKTGKRPGWDQLNAHLYQQAAYAIGASIVLERPVTMGGLITPRHYKMNALPETCPAGIFWHYPHKFDDLEFLLNTLRRIVANIRSGEVTVNPGDYCRYCPAHGTEECVPLLRSSTNNTRRIALRVTG